MKEVKEGYKMTELGVIPNEWNIKTLSDVSEIIMGQSPESSSYNDEKIGIAFFQGKTEFGRINPIVKKWCSKPTKISNPLDILISVRAPVGDVNINNVEACIGRGLAAIRQTDNSNYRYLYYLIQKLQPILLKSAQGSTFEAINSGDLKALKLPMPSIKEQKKIALILSTVDEQIDNTEKLIQKNQELKKGLMQQLLTKGIGHTEFKKTEIGEIPKEWEVKKLSEIAAKYKNSIVDGPFGSNLKTSDYVEQGILVMQSNYITGGKFELRDTRYISKEKAKELERSKVKSGDILMAKIGANFGMAEIIPEEINYGILSSNSLKIDLDSSIALNKFYIYLIKYYKNNMIIDKLASITAQPALSLNNIKNLMVPVPTINEQEKIALILLTLDKNIEQFKNKKEKLEESKKGLMQQLLMGNIRVDLYL